MKNIRSHFRFTKGQRNGVFLLLGIIISLQLFYYLYNNRTISSSEFSSELKHYQDEIDSLKLVKIAETRPKIFPFNPNFITDFKGYTLGMSNEEIDRLISFREKDQWINSSKQFQEVTQVSDTLLAEISPYFKFPDWVTNPPSKKSYSYENKDIEKSYGQKIDLNIATESQLKGVNGIGEVLSKRIVDYRSKQGGSLIADVQLHEVYGVSPEVINRILKQFTVKTPAPVLKLNLNAATRDQLVKIKYIDYEVAHNILEYRILNEGYKSLDELLKVKDFPDNKIEIIKLYLQLN